MAIEPKRGCGYRKVGGLYLCGEGSGTSCCLMPILMTVCPTCNCGIKQSRTFQWIDPKPWLKPCAINDPHCPLFANGARLGDKVGLIWIGERFYPTPTAFTNEAVSLGISRRIKVIPRGLEVGKTWVWFIHPKVKFDHETDKWIPGVFRVFRPTRIEQIITERQFTDAEFMDKLIARGIKPVIVPDNDPDHSPTQGIKGKGKPRARQLEMQL